MSAVALIAVGAFGVSQFSKSDSDEIETAARCRGRRPQVVAGAAGSPAATLDGLVDQLRIRVEAVPGDHVACASFGVAYVLQAPAVDEHDRRIRPSARHRSWLAANEPGRFQRHHAQLRDLWDRAATAGCQPGPGELDEAVDDIADSPYRFEAKGLRQVSDCSVIDLDAIVPGFVIDIAVDKAMHTLDLGDVTVSSRNRTLHPLGR